MTFHTYLDNRTIILNLIASTVLVVVSGVAMCFQVAQGPTVDVVMGLVWLAIWFLSMFIGLQTAVDAVEFEWQERECWIAAMVGPILNEEALSTWNH